jgi:hypothetical protein
MLGGYVGSNATHALPEALLSACWDPQIDLPHGQ